MSSFEDWRKNIRVRLADLQEQLSDTSGEPNSPTSPSTSQLLPQVTSPPFTSPILLRPGSSCSTNPLFEDPNFRVLESPLPFGNLDFEQLEPEVIMTSLREENGQVQGNQEGGRPSNITYPAVADGKTSDFD